MLVAMLTAAVLAAGSGPPVGAISPRAVSEPLSSADIALYLEVLRASVQRVKNPTPADRVAAEKAERAIERQRRAYDAFVASYPPGVKPTPRAIETLKASNPTQAESRAMAYAQALRLKPDLLVAREKHIDVKHYAEIRRVINRLFLVEQDRDQANGSATEPLRQIDEENLARLSPYKAEIREAIEVISHGRDPDRD